MFRRRVPRSFTQNGCVAVDLTNLYFPIRVRLPIVVLRYYNRERAVGGTVLWLARGQAAELRRQLACALRTLNHSSIGVAGRPGRTT